MNNICIYAEVIALARFFLRLLLSPQILNIQHPSPATALGAQGSDPVFGLGLPLEAKGAPIMEWGQD